MKSSVAEPATSPVAYRDLREWIEGVEAMGELKTIRNVHWDREMGAMVEMSYWKLSSWPKKFRKTWNHTFIEGDLFWLSPSSERCLDFPVTGKNELPIGSNDLSCRGV